jgi:hypothetical protein
MGKTIGAMLEPGVLPVTCVFRTEQRPAPALSGAVVGVPVR